MFGTLAIVAIGLFLVLGTVGIAFVFGLALQGMVKFLIGDVRISIFNHSSNHPSEVVGLAVTGVLLAALVSSPLLFLLAFDRVWAWLVQVLL
jgi:hypothetical protein